MAATLNSEQEELTFFSFPIEKQEDTATINPVDGTPDVLIWGKATDGTIDGDREIVDPDWSAKAIQEWASSKANVRMSHDPKRPVGKGQEVHVTTDGHYVKSLIADPLAKHFIRLGVLNDYSVGISMPDFRYRDPKLDPQGKASRIITGRPDGQSRIAEISICDRGSNFNSSFQIVKSAGGFTGAMVGDEDEIAKAAPSGLLTKMAPADGDMVNVDLPKGASISISPADFAKLRTFKQELVTKTAAVADKRDVSTANPQDDSDSTSKGTVTDTAEKSDAPEAVMPAEDAALKEAEPDVTKDPEPDAEDKPVKKAKKKPKGPKKMPPWLNKPDDDGDADDTDKSCKGAHAWIHVGGDSPVPDIRCEKCKTTPAQAAGLTSTHDMSPAPVPDLLESPPMASTKAAPTPQAASSADEAESMDPAPSGELNETPPPTSAKAETSALEAGMMKMSPEVAAILRFKAAGIDAELGRIHDLTCPAYHPEDVAKCHPFAALHGIDVDAFQREAVKAACGPDMDRAKSLQKAWQAAGILKGCDEAVLNDFRLAAHKAFRDANPGPTSAPTPGTISPQRYNRPLITDGHEASSTGHDGPNSSPQVATTAPNAHSFDRPPLASGHQSPSPSHMKGGNGEYPSMQGIPTQLNYAQMEKDKGRMALVQMHDHLSRQFPEVCPMDKPGSRPLRGVQPENHPVPAIAGIGKSIDPAPAAPAPAVTKAPAEDQFMDEAVYKGFKKMRKKLGKKVLAGTMTVDEARARMGRQFAQKAAEPEPEVAKAAAVTPVSSSLPGAEVVYNVSSGLDPAVIKAAVREALRAETVPLEPATIGSFDPSPAIEAAVTKAVTPLLEKIQAQDTQLAETKRVIDAIADQPDPSTASFSGLAFNPVRTARPAGVAEKADHAERVQQMTIRSLQELYNSSSDPYEREGYYKTIAKMRGAST